MTSPTTHGPASEENYTDEVMEDIHRAIRLQSIITTVRYRKMAEDSWSKTVVPTREFAAGDLVWFFTDGKVVGTKSKKDDQRRWRGPARVIHVDKEARSIQVEFGGRSITRSLDAIKKYLPPNALIVDRVRNAANRAENRIYRYHANRIIFFAVMRCSHVAFSVADFHFYY